MLERHCADIWHEYRGCLPVVQRVETDGMFWSETFVHELTKQLTPQLINTIGVELRRIKRKNSFITIHHHIDKCKETVFYKDEIYTLISLSVFYSCSFWLKFYPVEPTKDFETFSCQSEEIPKLKFELVFDVPEEVKKIYFSHLLEDAEKAKTVEKKKELLEWYQHCITYPNDNWVKEFQKEFGINQKEEDLSLTPEQKQFREFLKSLKFMCEIRGGNLPKAKVEIVLLHEESEELTKKVYSMLEKFVNERNEKYSKENPSEFIPYIALSDPVENRSPLAVTCIDIDFGNCDPLILVEFLTVLHKSKFKIGRVNIL